MSHKKRILEETLNDIKEDDNEPPPKKRKIDNNPYLNNNEWWKGSNTNNGDDTFDEEEQGKNDLIDYFANIDYMITNESFDNDEDEQMFINNIIKEMERFNDTIFIFEHPDISKVIEKIIQILPSIHIIQFIQKFVMPNLLDLITKKCSSHVLQTLFSLIPRILIEQQSLNDTNDTNEMSDLLMEIIDKLQEYDIDNYGLSQLLISEKSTFVIRDLLWISCGVVRFNKTKKKHRMKLHNVRKIPTLQKFSLDHVPLSVVKFGSILTSNLLKYKDKYPLSTHIKHHKFRRDKHSNILCGSLEVLVESLFITKSNEILQALIDEILRPPPAKRNKDNKNESEKDRIKKHILEMIMNESSSHLIQTIFEFGNKNVSLFIVKNYLNAKDIRDISFNNNGNYVLQSMLRRLFDIKSIQFIASSVQHNIIELFDKNKVGFLYCLIDAFTRKNLKPNAMVKTILNQINNINNNNDTQDNNNIIYKFLYLNLNGTERKENLIKSKIMPLSSQYSVLGCLLLQSIIKCNSNLSVTVYKSLLLLDTNEIINICKDSSGSHVIQCFIECKYIFNDIKWQFLSKIQDKFHILCLDKFGNYIMESTFFCLNFPYKQEFALKLLNSESILKGSKIGLMLYVKMKLDLFKRDKNKWKQTIMKQRKHQNKNYFKSKDNNNNGSNKNKTRHKNNKNTKNTKNTKNSKNSKNSKNKGRKMKKSNKLF